MEHDSFIILDKRQVYINRLGIQAKKLSCLARMVFNLNSVGRQAMA